MKISKVALNAFTRHVLADYPKEACGLLVNNKYVKCKNVAVDPVTDFEIDPSDLVKAQALGEIQAVLHSHPYKLATHNKWNPAWPSTADMECWIQDSLPWGIVSTDGEGLSEIIWLDDNERAPLEGREFVHGVNDCYSIVRDYYHEKGIEIKNYARGIEWWHKGGDLYSENFEDAGFYEISASEATIGDVCLLQIGSPVINHAAVITANDEIIHHLMHRLSYKDSIHRWRRSIVKYLRYKGTDNG